MHAGRGGCHANFRDSHAASSWPPQEHERPRLRCHVRSRRRNASAPKCARGAGYTGSFGCTGPRLDVPMGKAQVSSAAARYRSFPLSLVSLAPVPAGACSLRPGGRSPASCAQCVGRASRTAARGRPARSFPGRRGRPLARPPLFAPQRPRGSRGSASAREIPERRVTREEAKLEAAPGRRTKRAASPMGRRPALRQFRCQISGRSIRGSTRTPSRPGSQWSDRDRSGRSTSRPRYRGR